MRASSVSHSFRRMNDKIDHLKIAFLVLIVAGTLSYAENEARHEREHASTNGATEPSRGAAMVSATSRRGEVTDANRASKIIGMEVKNRANERIGRVKDIVIDVPSGRVAYAVLATGLLGDDKLIAMPLEALTWAPGARSLVLDAPKDRWETAVAFADDDWPGLDAARSGKTIGLAGSSGEFPVHQATNDANGTKTPSRGVEAKKQP